MPGCLSGREALRSMKIQISDSQMKVKLTTAHRCFISVHVSHFAKPSSGSNWILCSARSGSLALCLTSLPYFTFQH